MSESFIDSHYTMDRIYELEKIWQMIFSVLPKDIPCYLPNIYEAMLRRFKIPFENWEKSVKDILISESRRSDSPIKQHTGNSFIVDVHLESWLPTRKDYLPNFERIVHREIKEMESEKTPFACANRLRDPAFPPGMSLDRANRLKVAIFVMNDPVIRSTVIASILQLPRSDGLHYARGVWRMALYNDVLLKTVFETFCELANKSSTWAELVLDTIFCLELHPQDEVRDFNYLIDTEISYPPNVSRVRIAGFLQLLNYMNQSLDNLDNVTSWLLKKHTNQFKSIFVDTLGNLGLYNEHLWGAIRRIFRKLLHCKSWAVIIATTGANSVDEAKGTNLLYYN